MIDELGTSLEHTTEIIAAIPDNLYDAPTPCPEMTVRGLVNHIVAGNKMFAATARGEQLDLSLFEQDHLGEDAAGAYRDSGDEAIAAWSRPGVFEEILPFGGMPGAFVIRLHITEELVHGWDLAQSTGQDTATDERLAALALEAMQQVPPDMLRSGIGFGEEVIVEDDAPMHERLVAFLGRDPAVTPG
jgi:uncharacterized protein (TIGR03086 family)